MEELWLQTRKRTETERRVLEELTRVRNELRPRLRLVLEGYVCFHAGRLSGSRRELAQFWIDIGRRLRAGRVEALLRLDRILLNGLREGLLAAEFTSALITRGRTHMSRSAPG